MASYVTDRSPYKYGGQQDSYLQIVKETVSQGVSQLRTAVGTGADVTQLFHEILDSFAEIRHKIAVEHGTRSAKFFGQRRDAPESLAVCYSTCLSYPYEDYNDKMVRFLQQYLRQIPHTLYEFSSNKDELNLKIDLPVCLGRESKLELSVLSAVNVDEWRPFEFEELIQIGRSCGAFGQKADKKITRFDVFNIVYDYEAMTKLREQSLPVYNQLILGNTIGYVYDENPDWRKSEWVLAKLQLQVDDKFYTTSQFLTWMNRDHITDPVDYMTGRAVVYIMHQDPFFIPEMLKDAAKLFKEIVEWDGEEVQHLKDRVALWQYEFSNTAPYKRGNAAICEWLEMMVYEYHGFTEFSYAKDKSVNLEALTSSLDQFVANYGSMVILGDRKPVTV